ncbi:hypothetical protein COV56_02355 [Candidatus Kuenenbacteria bacterium CG11_big_fil_rev_8_21_14_0_20_37_9]|nr:MAG: hypothetical protein COV56_02355 [Candidatus Kuenenbacteria bacterium CG11_big_fil_rev_8_21_14_0_20_37_9]
MLHDEWRKPRLKDGLYESRVKKTKDQDWIKAHRGTDEVDIANTDYINLPSDWQAENKASAEVAVDEVLKNKEKNFDNSFIEAVSAVVHEK